MPYVADRMRQGDRDGRGNLSLATLMRFTGWFLQVCLDQVKFMDELLDIGVMADRHTRYAAEQNFRAVVAELLRAVLTCGHVGPRRYCRHPRGRAQHSQSCDQSADGEWHFGVRDTPVRLRFTFSEPYPMWCFFRTLSKADRVTRTAQRRPSA